MGTKLLPAVQVRNTIKELVSTGVVEGDLVEQWKKSMAAKENVEKMKKRAEDGDVRAMVNLGCTYRKGDFGLCQDHAEAYRWFKKAADLKDTAGMCLAGFFLTHGLGVKTDVVYGMMLLTLAAERGSDLACFTVGWWFQSGVHGMRKDKKEALYWYKRATDGSCSVQHAGEKNLKKAEANLRKLEANE
mmetsp:Transcript_20656/g.42129  ORF Transcript_20656/g.42129 Transcript_20656/m.42129 type:complete len:188 (-) Transcript_20656:772-1335(-)